MIKKWIFLIALLVITTLTIFVFVAFKQAHIRARDPQVLMNMYYRLQHTNPLAAKRALFIALQQDPAYLPALKEQELLFRHQIISNKVIQAIKVFPYLIEALPVVIVKASIDLATKVIMLPVLEKPLASVRGSEPSGETMKNPTVSSVVDNDFQMAMQLGYMYDAANNKPLAYKYFQLATKSHDKSQALRAQNALTTLSGQQTRALPDPYFVESFFNPFTQTRFGLTVRPFILRAGVEQPNCLKTREYVFFRRTDDNRSQNLGQISQIYEDNVQITGVGGQITPISKIPIIGFVEAGTAYDLVYRDRNRWRGDLRVGLMYYQDFGVRPAYYDNVKLSHDYYSDWYADTTYFSRYTNNVIGGIRTHQGVHLLQYKSSLLNLYIVARALADTHREFFNNLAEAGPGIAFIPSNRFNLQLRFEHVYGAYLPAASIPANPYRQHYTNNIVQLLFYVKI